MVDALIALDEFGVMVAMVVLVFWLCWQFSRGIIDVIADWWCRRHVYYKLQRHLSEMRSGGRFCAICVIHLETQRPDVWRELTLGKGEK